MRWIDISLLLLLFTAACGKSASEDAENADESSEIMDSETEGSNAGASDDGDELGDDTPGSDASGDETERYASCEGVYLPDHGPQCCDEQSPDPPLATTGIVAECRSGEWECLAGERYPCRCGPWLDDVAPVLAPSRCISSCDANDDTFAICVFNDYGPDDHWTCPEGMIFRSTCTEGDTGTK